MLKRFLIHFCLVLASCLTAHAEKPFKPEFYAFQNGLPKTSYTEEAKILKELGYDGISQVHGTGEQLESRVTEYAKHDLKVLSVYLSATETPIDPELVKPLANGGMIELTVRKITPGMIPSIRKTAEMAARQNIRVVLYPHHGFAVATMPQAIALAEQINHPNLGIMFNLCHFLKNEKAEDLEAILQKADPYLFAVSTSGADLDGTDWNTLIQTLDKGSFPQERLFNTLRKLDFKGPVGLQCYALKGDKTSNLRTSIAAWEKLLDELN